MVMDMRRGESQPRMEKPRTKEAAFEARPIDETPLVDKIVERQRTALEELAAEDDFVASVDAFTDVPVEKDPQIALRDKWREQAPTVDEEEKPTGFMAKLARSRLFKAAAGLAAFAGVAGTVGVGGEKLSEASTERDMQYEKAANIVLKSTVDDLAEHGFSFSGLPQETDTVHFKNGQEAERGDVIRAMNEWYTDYVSKHNASSLDKLAEQCGETAADGSVSLDAELCHAMYGNQIKLPEQGLHNLSVATGYSPEELVLEGKIIRESVVVRPTGFVVGGGVVSMTAFEAGRLPGEYANNAHDLLRSRLQFAQSAGMHAVQALDLTHETDAKTLGKKLEVIRTAIQADITAQNDQILIAGDVGALWNYDLKESLIHGTVDEQGVRGESDLSVALRHEETANLAWKKLAAYEKDRKGSLHQLAHSLEDVRNDRLTALLKTGLAAGIETDFFREALQEREKSTDVAVK